MSGIRNIDAEARVASLTFELSAARDEIASLKRQVADLRSVRVDYPRYTLPPLRVRGPKFVLLGMLLRRSSVTVDMALFVLYGSKEQRKSHVVSTFMSELRSMLAPYNVEILIRRGERAYHMTRQHKSIVRAALEAGRRA